MKSGLRNTLATLALVGGAVGFLEGCREADRLTPEEANALNNSNELVEGTIVGISYYGGGLERVEGRHVKGAVSQAYTNPTSVPGKSILTAGIDLDGDDKADVALKVLGSHDGNFPKEMFREIYGVGDRIGFTRGNLLRMVTRD